MKLPNKLLERKLLGGGYNQIIAVDEVGMGCLAGPVVVCAVTFDKKFFQKPHFELNGIRDSKSLSPAQREKLAAVLLVTPGLQFRLARCLPCTIDRLNIYQAARTAMRRAVSKLKTKNCIVLVDGPHKIAHLDLPQLAITKGDRKVFAIACASIIAKVHRDRTMRNYAKRYPHYGFERHKGYGTKLHIAQLTARGPTPIHRRSFTPVGKLL